MNLPAGPSPSTEKLPITPADLVILRQKYRASSSLLMELGAHRTQYLLTEQDLLGKIAALRQQYDQTVTLMAERYLGAESFPEGVYELDLEAGAFVRRQE